MIGPSAGLICIPSYDHRAPPSPSICRRSCARLPPPVSIFHEGKESSAAASVACVCVEPARRAEFTGRWNMSFSFFESFLVRHFWRPNSPRRFLLRPGWKSPSAAGWVLWSTVWPSDGDGDGSLLAWYPNAGWGFLRGRRFLFSTDTRVIWSEAAILWSRSIVCSFGVKPDFFVFRVRLS